MSLEGISGVVWRGQPFVVAVVADAAPPGGATAVTTLWSNQIKGAPNTVAATLPLTITGTTLYAVLPTGSLIADDYNMVTELRTSGGALIQSWSGLLQVRAATEQPGGVSISKFDTPGTYTWNVPFSAKALRFQVLGAGAGGGSGRRGAAGTTCCGGGGGAGSDFADFTLMNLVGLPATLYVTVGAGGAGGGGVTTDDTNGSPGVAGGLSVVSAESNIATNSRLLRIAAGQPSPGNGGSALSGAGGSSTLHAASLTVIGGSGAAANTSGLAGVSASNTNVHLSAGVGGGSGAGITSADAVSNGGGGGSHAWADSSSCPAGGISPGGAAESGGGGPMSYTGGGGGASSTTSPGGSGGSGGRGCGGGGGSASRNGFVSGAGGKGGDGLVIITAYF